jgi:large subunit ribosomal protein L3
MGRERVTVLNLKVVKVDLENRTILVRGAVPGSNRGTVVVRAAVKK